MARSWPRQVLAPGVMTLLAGFILTAIHWGAGAQEPDSPVFAIIDVQRVLRKSVAVKALSRHIEERKGQYQGELRKKEDALREADQELARQRSILSAEVYGQKRGELEQKVASHQREARKRKRELEQIFASGMNKVRNELRKIAKEIAEERGLDLILSKATVVTVKPEFEITEEAVNRLNARLPEVPLAQELN